LSDKERVVVGLDIRKPKAAKARAKA